MSHDVQPDLRTLRPREIVQNTAAFLGIAADVPGEYWSAENFLRDLPEKWDLSFALWLDNAPIGYAVLSRRSEDTAHLHHFMLAPAHRERGLGVAMATEMERRARERDARRLTLKVSKSNSRAKRFYSRLGYRVIDKAGDFLVYAKTL